MAKNLKGLRLRIRSVKNTAKITRTMSMIAASKMRKAQTLAQSGRIYLQRLDQLVNKILANQKKNAKKHPFIQKTKGERTLVILIASDRGLAGSLNTNLFKEVIRKTGEDYSSVDFIAIGKTAVQFVGRRKFELMEGHPAQNMLTKGEAVLLSQKIKDFYQGGLYKSIFIASNDFVSTLKQVPTYKQILPFEKKGDDEFSVPAIYEPTKEETLDYVIEHAIITRVAQSLLDADASEHSARMVAMQSATDNAKKLSEELTLEMNQARQDAITKELLDIANAAESVS